MVAPPHGGSLVRIEARSPETELTAELREMVQVPVRDEDQVNIENVSRGALSPLEGFMNLADYENVIDNMRLADDTPWTIPLILRLPRRVAISSGDEVCLTTEARDPLGVLVAEDQYDLDNGRYAESVFGTKDPAHPGVQALLSRGSHVIGGRLRLVLRRPPGPFDDFILTPAETRVLFEEKGWKEVMAFQTRNAPHIGHEYLQKTGLAMADGLFINPVIGRKKAGDFRDEVIVRAYSALIRNYYPGSSVVLSALRYEMMYAGPKEAVMHAIIRKNFGCTMMAIGRDHAGVGKYYGPYAAQEIFSEFPDLGVRPVLFREFYYCKRCEGIANDRICPHGEGDRITFSGTQLRGMFLSGQVPPREFMRPEVAKVILESGNAFVE